ncbi:MAG: AarF/ABC1/UbiB kinase family protein [Natronospirillum sp.]|uniref:ABC1 kinase family protein n=1 Tax=Natronospirillum sp. TaxID=2812955 RepID=UPI0025D43287|nr:AarF/ABC1/UbiB kinase family protein [Natronospirillum sp.]MCH8553357.1 AarF/ABC1/UbiB kinase family protein [Natronospirillum sp.]
MGRLAGGIAGGVLSEGSRRWRQGQRPALRDLLLTPGNLGRMADQLSQMRGAAMKVGQLLSMDTGQVLPPELSDLLARLRSGANAMPREQLRTVLTKAWGPDWQHQFAEFNYRPLAAASIGQVHKAITKDGTHLAIKVQYPGVRQSIDSDVDNVAFLLRSFGLLPKGLDVQSLLTEAKAQLHREADYQQEAAAMQAYGERLTDAQDFLIPQVNTALTTDTALAMQFMCGDTIDTLVGSQQSLRNRVTEQLFMLLFRELFEWQMVQTDPNFANFLYDSSSRKTVLLDFGAVREYPVSVAEGYRRLLQAAIDTDREALNVAAEQIGYFSKGVSATQRAAVLDIFLLATEPLRHPGIYDFSGCDLAGRIREAGMRLSFEQEYWHSPPMDALFLHRKVAGLYLLAVRLQAQVDMRPLRQWLAESAEIA